MNRTSLLVALLVACTGGKAAKDPSVTSGSSATGGSSAAGGPSITGGSSADTGSAAMAQQMKPGAPKPSVNWTKGPAVTSPANDLLAWFAAQQRNGAPRMTRVPIVLSQGDAGWSNRGVKIGALEVYISDAALGQSIAMRAMKCQDPTCAFIVEGFWRGQQETGYHYEVRNAPKRPATADELAAFTHLEVEGESGN